MSVLRPYLVVLVGYLAAIPLVGFTACLWSFIGILVFAALDRVSDSVRSDSAGLVLAVVIARIAVIVGIAVLLFVRFDWVTCVVFVVLLLAFLTTRETFVDRAERHTDAVRADLARLVAARSAGEITDDQLAVRADRALTGRLPRLAYITESVATRLTRADSLPPAQHRLLLDQLARHTKSVKRFGPETALENAIRAAGRH
jgi:hypothetical protein